MNQLEYIFEFLDFSDIVRSALVCRRFNITYIKYFTLRSNTWILDRVDQYLSRRQILMAERILRYYICLNDISGNDPKTRNKFARDRRKLLDKTDMIRNDNKIISKYIYMISTYIWDNDWYNPSYRNHRIEIYKFLRKRVNDNINDYNIYIPINLYSHKNSDSNIVYNANLNTTPMHEYNIPYSSSIKPTRNYIIALIFTYICIRDKQVELAKNIIMSIENKKNTVEPIRQYNILYYLVKWHLTNNFEYLSLFKNSDFAFGMYIYGCKLYERNTAARGPIDIAALDRQDNTQFIEILYKCIELDPSFVNAINAIIATDNRFDLIPISIRSNPDHSLSYIYNLSLLFDKLSNITELRGPESIRQDNIMSKILDSVEDIMIFKLPNLNYTTHKPIDTELKLAKFKHSTIFINIHYMLSDTNLIVKNLVLLYRLYTHNCWLGNDMSACSSDIKSLLLYIKNNYNLTPEYKKYILDQLTFV